MKLLIVLCLALVAVAERSNHVRHENQRVQEKEYQRWQTLTRAEELDETNDAAEDEDSSSSGSFGSSRLGRVRLLKSSSERENLRELIRRGYADWEAYKELHGQSY